MGQVRRSRNYEHFIDIAAIGIRSVPLFYYDVSVVASTSWTPTYQSFVHLKSACHHHVRCFRVGQVRR